MANSENTHVVDGGFLKLDDEALTLVDKEGNEAVFPPDAVGELKAAAEAAMAEQSGDGWFLDGDVNDALKTPKPPDDTKR